MSTASSGPSLSPPPEPHSSSPQSFTYPPITVVLTIILLIFFFVGFFSIYFCRCFMQNILYTWHLRHSPGGTSLGGSAAPGLDPEIIKRFPTFTYANVKEYKTAKCGLECAICLIEFDDGDMVRHLLICDHVFHKECIDLWFESHKTCPVCRRNLDVKSETLVKLSPNNNVHENNTTSENNSTSGNEPACQDDNFVSITIKGEIHEDESTSRDKKGQNVTSCRQQDHDDDGHNDRIHEHDNQIQEHQEDHRHDHGDQIQYDDNSTNGQSSENKVVEKFSRSNTTGHSIFRGSEEEDRFTLKLPQHVKLSQLMKGHHKSSLSWNNYGEYSDVLLLRFLMEKSAANVSSFGVNSDSFGEISNEV